MFIYDSNAHLKFEIWNFYSCFRNFFECLLEKDGGWPSKKVWFDIKIYWAEKVSFDLEN